MKKIILIGILFLWTSVLYAQFPEPAADEDAGFDQILTENTFDNWEGDPTYWRFEKGVLIGEITEDKLLEENTFIIWRGGTVKDFELKVEYRVSAKGNSGINYRSEKIEGRRYALRGYQADLDGPSRWSGQVYEEKGRAFLALRGQISHVSEDDTPNVIGSLGEKAELSAAINDNGWNEYHIIARGNTIIQLINGRVMSIVIDDGKKRAMEGLLGVQVHQGPPMKIEYRNFRLKQFSK